MNHDDQADLPPEDEQQSSVAEISDLFNEITETVAEILTPEGIGSALENLFDRLRSDQSNGAERRDLVAGHAPATFQRDERGQDPASTDSAVLSRRADVHLAQSRDIGRAADNAAGMLESLVVPDRDLRTLSHGDREETQALIVEVRQLLSRCPARAFGTDDSAMVLGMVATLAERLIADRDERAALSLVRAASPLMGFPGRHHPVVFEVRRVGAEALAELGRYRKAETMLRRLAEDEQRLSGATDPRTTLLLHWTLVGQDRLLKAEEGYSSLEVHLKDLQPNPSVDRLLLHTRCRHAWVLGQLGRVEDSVTAYAQVISDRTRASELGKDHAETLDARHSQAKGLIVSGQAERALPLLERLLDDLARVQAADHPDTLETRKYCGIARALLEPRDDHALRDAIRDLEEIQHIQRKRRGSDHPMSRDTAEWHYRLLHVQKANRAREPLLALSLAVPADDKAQHWLVPIGLL